MTKKNKGAILCALTNFLYMGKKRTAAFLSRARNAFGELRTWLADSIVGKDKTVITLEKIGSIPVDKRRLLGYILDIEGLVRARKYDILLRLGLVEEFIKRHLESELIARYPFYKEELGQDIYELVLELIDEVYLEEYLRIDLNQNLEFFKLHPLGLKVLVENYYSGYVAREEAAFRRIAEEYPKEFAEYLPQEEYCRILKNILD